MAVLKHVRNWSFEETEREVRAKVVYREFTHIGAERVPDAKTMARQVQALGPEVVQQIQQRLVGVAREKKVVRGRKMRVDTTVVESNIHYPTDSSLLGDGVRVLPRLMKKITAVVGEAGTRLAGPDADGAAAGAGGGAGHPPARDAAGREAEAGVSAVAEGHPPGGEPSPSLLARSRQRSETSGVNCRRAGSAKDRNGGQKRKAASLAEGQEQVSEYGGALVGESL